MSMYSRRIARIGKGSFGVVIPKDFIRKLNWRRKKEVVVYLSQNKIIIKDSKR